MTREEAIEIVRKLYYDSLFLKKDKEAIETLIPGIKESEDERIRKDIINYIKVSKPDWEKYSDYSSWINWLEKQRTSEEAIQYLKEHHSSSDVSDFQAAMNIAVAKAFDAGKKSVKPNEKCDKDAEGVFGLKKNGDLIPASKVKPGDKDEYESIVIVKGNTCIEIAIRNPEGDFNFEESQKQAASLGEGWRCPTRHEWLDIYDSRFDGLNDLMEKFNISPIDYWVWTCEADADPKYSSKSAWYADFDGSLNLNTNNYLGEIFAVRDFRN